MFSPQSSPSAKPVERQAWLQVTVRVAWEMVCAGVKPRPQVIAAAREHVLLSLPPEVGPSELDLVVRALARDFLARVREDRYESSQSDHLDEVQRSALQEVDAGRIMAALSPVGEALWRMHYCDGERVGQVAARSGVPLSQLHTAQAGVREIARTVIAERCEGVEAWTDARVDVALEWLANRAVAGCPGPVGLLSEAGGVHADQCPRCSRAVRLVRAGVLAPSDLFPPDPGPDLQAAEVSLLAIDLHPDARLHRGTLARALDGLAVPVAGGSWLADPADLPAIHEAILPRARIGAPDREQLRLAVVTGRGSWKAGAALGPAASEALAAVRGQAWGELGPLPALPGPLPPPPSVRSFWMVALALVALTVVVGKITINPSSATGLAPLDAHFVSIDGGWDVRFDVDDLTAVEVVSYGPGGLVLVSSPGGVGKAAWATGEGDFALRVPGVAVALVGDADGDLDVAALVEGLATRPNPLAALEATLAVSNDAVQFARTPIESADPSHRLVDGE